MPLFKVLFYFSSADDSSEASTFGSSDQSDDATQFGSSVALHDFRGVAGGDWPPKGKIRS